MPEAIRAETSKHMHWDLVQLRKLGSTRGVLGIWYIAVFLIGYTVYLRYFQVFGIPKFCEFLV